MTTSMGIRDRLVATVCLAVLATCASTIFTQYQREESHIEEVFAAQTRLIADQTRSSVEAGDLPSVQKAFVNLLASGRSDNLFGAATSIAVFDPKGRPLDPLGSGADGPEENMALARAARRALMAKGVEAVRDGDLLAVAAPVQSQEDASRIGVVAISWDLAPARAMIKANTVRHAAGATVASLLVMLLVMVMLDRGVVSPLRRLQGHAAEIARGGSPAPIADPRLLERRDEVGALANVYNNMISEIGVGYRRIAEQSAEMQHRNMQFDTALANMSQGLCMYDGDGRLALYNDRFLRLYDLPVVSLRAGMAYEKVLEAIRLAGRLSDENVEDTLREHRTALERGAAESFVQYLKGDRVISITQVPMQNGGWVSTYEDVTERLSAESQIAHMALHDALTELPNRVLFRQELERALANTQRQEQIAVLCLDLDHFKAVNDTLGHPIGDQLLCAVARRLRGCLREMDTVARLGGDEFAIVQTKVIQPEDAAHLCRRLIEALSQPFEISGHHVVIGTSVGVAFAPGDSVDPDELLKCADLALFRSKADGRGTHRFFEKEMDARMQKRRLLELDLRAALAKGEFQVHYQPLVDVETSSINGFEALLRWDHPVRGVVEPVDFIPLAEEIGVISEIGMWVIRRACAAAVEWPEPLKVSVNLSPVQFKNKSLVNDIVAALKEAGLPPQRLELEITESVILVDTEQTLAMLHQMRAAGISIAMDDFGTGYSSLSYLQRFPFNRIKIDRSFVKDIDQRPNAIALIKAITDLGLSLGIATTAEGVETSAQLDQLRASGCSVVQGYLFSEAIPEGQIGAMLKTMIGNAAATDVSEKAAA